jgi:radical SAM superfamily enzyme YgiQ (UPF0313 family)
MTKKKKNIVIANFPRFSGEIWMPFLWAQAKTYYELYGERTDEWNWVPCYHDVYSGEYNDQVKELISNNPPDIFAISLYVWNYTQAFEIASWVKEQWPECVIISGGPHQYFKHDDDWFKKYPYLDASLPGDCYGELCFKETLDNYDNTTKTVNWKNVTDMWYPSKGRMALKNPISMSRSDKREYLFDWSSMDIQLELLKEFVDYQQDHFPDSMLLSVIETTRGCPYGCTYCDWGGGTSTTVLQKTIPTVKKDIDALMNFDTTYLYVADANFGIFGDRDVEIMRYLADSKIRHRRAFGVGYGGYAKTENKVEYIKDILKINIDYDLSMTKELKLSMQSLDEQVCKNIDRKNIPMDKQLEIYEPLAKNNKLPLYVEMIMALPGINLDKYYYELDKLGKHNLSVQWFEWILLPETPAYASAYRKQYGIQTILKHNGWGSIEPNSEREVVVACDGMNDTDYLQMILSNSLYHLFVQGGFYRDCINWIIKKHNIGHGVIARKIYEDWFTRIPEFTSVLDRWNLILTDPTQPCTFDINGEEIYGHYYFPARCFDNPEFAENMLDWLAQEYDMPKIKVNQERIYQITHKTFGKKIIKGLSVVDHTKDFIFHKYNAGEIVGAYRNYIDSGNTQRARKRLFGLI